MFFFRVIQVYLVHHLAHRGLLLLHHGEALVDQRLVRLVVNEADENDGHVVAAETPHRAVVGEAAHHQLFADLRRFEALRDPSNDEVRHLLVGQHVPDAVAREDDEMPVLVDFANLDVWATGDDLLFRSLVWIGLEGEVTECSGQREVAVDPIDLDEPAGLLDPLLLVLVRRLVIDAEGDRRAVADASDATRVADVGHVDVLVLE